MTGREAEEPLINALRHTFAAVGAVNDDREPMAVLVQYAGRDFLLAQGNAMLQVEGVQFDRDKRCVRVPLPAGSDEQVRRLANALWSAGFGPDDVHRLNLEPAPPGPELPRGPTPNDFDISVGGKLEHKRAFIKMALELVAYRRPDLVLRGELSEARRFARHGTGTFRGKPDMRSIGSGLLPQDGLPEVFNSVEVWTFGQSLFFRIMFLSSLAFTGTLNSLTSVWSGEAFRTAYAFDARMPSNRVVDTLVAGDGPNLEIWFEGLRVDANAGCAVAIEEISRRLAERAAFTPPRQEAPPDVELLREAVRAKLASMPAKRKRK